MSYKHIFAFGSSRYYAHYTHLTKRTSFNLYDPFNQYILTCDHLLNEHPIRNHGLKGKKKHCLIDSNTSHFN